MFSPENLITLNKLAGEQGKVIKQNQLYSCFASIDYLSSDEEKIASVARSVMQSHPFADGNKRTGVLWIITASDLKALPLADISEDDWVNFAVKSVVDRWSIRQIVNFFYL